MMCFLVGVFLCWFKKKNTRAEQTPRKHESFVCRSEFQGRFFEAKKGKKKKKKRRKRISHHTFIVSVAVVVVVVVVDSSFSPPLKEREEEEEEEEERKERVLKTTRARLVGLFFPKVLHAFV